MDVLGISCITNLAAGLENREISHGDVLEAAERSQGQLTALLTDLIPQIASE
jgi:purine-nucleoside phosphorylase